MSARSVVTISHRCPREHCRARMRLQVERDGRVETTCPGCRDEIVINIPADLAKSGAITKCACCPGREFFVRKDFPQKIGLLLVVVFGLAATVLFYQRIILASFAVLGSLVVIDALIFLFVGKVTVCYRCRAEYRGVAYNPDHEGFDLATSEKYD